MEWIRIVVIASYSTLSYIQARSIPDVHVQATGTVSTPNEIETELFVTYHKSREEAIEAERASATNQDPTQTMVFYRMATVGSVAKRFVYVVGDGKVERLEWRRKTKRVMREVEEQDGLELIAVPVDAPGQRSESR